MSDRRELIIKLSFPHEGAERSGATS